MQACIWIQLVGALAATCVGIVAGNLSDGCPALVSGSEGNCLEQCSSDADCESYEACCSNGCGHACVNVTRPPGISHGQTQQCPPVDRESVGQCVEECTSDVQCEAGQVCCSNGCGHSCTKPLEQTLTKPGRCPQVYNRTSSVGVCAEECSWDGDCPGRQKCCSNGCGHACTDRADVTDGPQVHAGSCPEIAEGSVGVCSEECSIDEDCNEDQKCCSNGCGHVCEDPTKKVPPEPKPGYCPLPPASSMGVCSEECSSDEDCTGDQKCCSNGCGHICEDPTKKVPSEPKPGYCPVPLASSMGVCSEECSSDEDCTGDQKCCSNGCGHVCMTTTTDQIPQNHGCRLGENFYHEGEIIPTEGCNECRCAVGEVKCTIKDDCQGKVPFTSAVVMPVVFCSVGILMTCILMLIFARCFLLKPASKRSRYKLMHEIPDFEPDVGDAMKNGNVL